MYPWREMYSMSTYSSAILFSCWKIFDYSFDFLACDWSVQIMYLFLVHFWNVILFKEFVHFFQVVHFTGIQLLIVVSYDLLYFCVAGCESSIFISNFIDLIFSLFSLMSQANSLSILFIFSKRQLLVLLIFAIVSFVSFSLISALIFMISFLLLTLPPFYSSFSNCFRCKFRFFI